MARVLAISSQVAHGAIGLSAAVPALNALGHEVIALPTILLSNHPGHARFAGERVATDLLARMLEALAANGWLAGLDAVLTGYLPSPEHVAFAAECVARVRQVSPSATYVCDPVLGDHPKGLYIQREAAEAIRDRLLPAADVLKMNRFECEWLAGAAAATVEDAAGLARARGWPLAIVTSLAGREPACLANVLVDHGGLAGAVDVARRPRVPNGTGDLMGGLWLAHRLAGRAALQAFEHAVAGVELVLARSEGADELRLAPSLGALAR